jgi:hypothetical protein
MSGSSNMNSLIRRAARGGYVPLEPDHPGDIGIGRGGGNAHVARSSTNEQINAKLRLAAHQATNRVELGVDLDDVWR